MQKFAATRTDGGVSVMILMEGVTDVNAEVAKLPPERHAVIGDDIDMDIALGHLGGSRTILVRSGMSGKLDLDGIPDERRPDAVIDGVEEMLPWL